MSRTKIPFPVRVPFVESLGLELHACAHGASELRVDLADAHMNSWEVAHGGVLDCLYRAALRLELAAPRTWQMDNASINRLLYVGQGFSVVGWNDSTHLGMARGGPS